MTSRNLSAKLKVLRMDLYQRVLRISGNAGPMISWSDGITKSPGFLPFVFLESFSFLRGFSMCQNDFRPEQISVLRPFEIPAASVYCSGSALSMYRSGTFGIFRRFLSTFVCLFLASFLLSGIFSALNAAESAAVTPGHGVIPNASFEIPSATDTLPADWRAPKEKFSRSTEEKRTGTASFHWKNEDPAAYRLSQASVNGLVPGESYVLSAWVKSKNVRGGKASVCIEWSGPDGKWLGGAYVRGVNGTKDWTKITQVFHFPENARNPHISCYGTREGGTVACGEAWFDDLEILPYIPPCIRAVTTDQYRNQTTGGKVRFFAGLTFTEADFTVDLQKRIVLEIAEIDSGKKLQTLRDFTWSATPDAGRSKSWLPGKEVLTFELDTETLAPGKYALTLKVPNPKDSGALEETETVTLTKLTEFPERKSFIDEHRRLIVDGKPYFPLGLYFHQPTDEDIARLADSPFNCIMCYPRITRERLDRLHENGIDSIYSVKDLYEGLHCKTDEEGRRKTAEVIQTMKDHPAVIAWYINDELPLSMREVLTGHRDLVEELDPSRPAWVVLYQVEDIRDYLPTFDVIGTDPYPLPSKPASTAYEWARKTHDACFGVRACWQVPQYFNWANYGRSKETSRTPTYEEMRAMTWMNIAGGANGIIGYSYYDFYRNYAGRDGSPEEKQKSFDRTWKDVCRVGEEVKKYEQILLSIDPPAAVSPASEFGQDIAVRLYGNGEETWILLVNTQTESRTASFTLPDGLRVKNAADWPNVKITEENKTLTVEFPALEPAFLQLGK